MAVTLKTPFDRVNKLIEVPAPTTDVLVRDLYTAIRNEEALAYYNDLPPIVSASGYDALGGGDFTVVTMVMNDGWKVQFEARAGPSYTECRFTGGNIIAETGSPFQGTAYVIIVSALATTGAVIDGGGMTLAEWETEFPNQFRKTYIPLK